MKQINDTNTFTGIQFRARHYAGESNGIRDWVCGWNVLSGREIRCKRVKKCQ